jgi:hypothetical protein
LRLILTTPWEWLVQSPSKWDSVSDPIISKVQSKWQSHTLLLAPTLWKHKELLLIRMHGTTTWRHLNH